jgi:hypothetical protein
VRTVADLSDSFNELKFEQLWSVVDQFMLRINPCDIVDGTCLNAREGDGDNFCCGSCEHLNEKGCGTTKPLTCRVWLCQTAVDNLPLEEVDNYFKLYDSVCTSGFFQHRASKDQLKTLCVSSAGKVNN